jgi:hypothetical protein
MKRTSVSMWLSAIVCLSQMAGCSHKEKEEDAKTTESSQVVPAHVTENDMYMQKLEQDIDIIDPDSLIEDVNQQVGDNKANAELARRNAISGSAVSVDTAAAQPAIAPVAPEKPAVAVAPSAKMPQ